MSEKRAITDGPFGSNLARRHYTPTGPRVVRLQNIGDGRFIDAKTHISEEHFQTLSSHEVLAGDLLVASLGEVLPRACLAPASLGPAIVKADCIRVRLNERVDPRWVMYSLQRPEARKWAERHLHGVGRLRLGMKVVRGLPVPLPSLREQRQITEVLEDHLTRLDAATSGLRVGSDRLKFMRISQLSALRRELLEVAPEQRIGELCDTSLGKMLDAKKQSGMATPYLRNINVRWGSFDLSDVKSTLLTEEERSRLSLRPGDLLVCEGGEPGRCAVWDEAGTDLAFQKALHRVRVKPGTMVRPAFVALMLTQAVQSGRCDDLFTGTTIKHLPQEKLRQIAFPVPSLRAQDRILASTSDACAVMDRLQERLEQSLVREQRLRRALLQAAFSGQLVGANSDMDRVEELAGV